ncbi:serine hydrolase [Actinosynnema pretiosum]|uniref:Serine hydrolase n=1 Tax=Actinosynnema pretiosum TaxID=42197 RepID=A0A290Z2L2_9PSEU|nr:serine hydrolase [Actinosynnema pretiosum]
MGRGVLEAAGLSRLETVLAAHVHDGAVPGVVALVARGDEVHAQVHGAADRGALRRDALFRLGELSGAVTATAAVLLVQECAIGLDDPVARWLPELAELQVASDDDVTEPARRPVVVRDLLTMTAGLPALPIATRDGQLEPDEWLRRLAELPLAHQPGLRWAAGSEADVLGVLLARAVGEPLGEVLRTRLFEPLGMADTGFRAEPERLGSAYAHHPESGALVLADSPWNGRHSAEPVFESGADGLLSTADDVLALHRALLGERPDVLCRSAAGLITSDLLTDGQRAGLPEPAWGFGLGVDVRVRRTDFAGVGQFGRRAALGASAFSDPGCGLTGVLLTSVALDHADSRRLHRDFWTAAYQAV